MKFNQITDGYDCNCLEDTFQDIENTFCLKTNKNHLRETDFKSKWEKGERPNTYNCREVCSKKGKSISILNGDNMERLGKMFSEMFTISPTYKPFITKVKFSYNNGVVKKSPTKRNEYHYDFYKCDNFKFTHVEFVESIPLEDYV